METPRTRQTMISARPARLLAASAALASLLAAAAALGLGPLPAWLTGADTVAAAARSADAPVSERAGAGSEAPISRQDSRGAAFATGPLWEGGGHRLARIRRGGRISVHASPGGKRVGGLTHRTEFGSPRVFSVIGREGGWLEVTIAAFKDNRTLWIPADRRALSFSTTRLSLHADLSERTLELRRGGRTLRRITVTVGAPGTETPTGRFAVSDALVGGLNPVYGCCALVLSALQDGLPESWAGGDRVAIHATSAEVGHASSLGCLRATEPDLRDLVDRAPVGTPTFIEP